MVRFDFSGAIEFFSEAKTVALCGHKNPDGDCLGSVLALTRALRCKGIQATPLLATEEKPALYDFLPGYELLIPASQYAGSPDVFVMLDVPSYDRMADGAAVANRAEHVIKIDHHPGPEDIAEFCYIDTEAAAVGILVWDLIEQMDIKRDSAMACCCYTSLLTDTGSFRYQNSGERAFSAAARMVSAGADPAFVATNVYQRKSLAALQLEARVAERIRFACNGRLIISWMGEDDLRELNATKDDSEELTDLVRSVSGPEVSVILREQADCIRGSIRSKTDYDVSAIAKKMNGGGHRGASGFTLHGDMASALQRVVDLVAESFGVESERIYL